MSRGLWMGSNSPVISDRRRYYREYMRRWRSETPEERSQRRQRSDAESRIVRLRSRSVEPPLCRVSKKICTLAGTAHRHCECGLPIHVDEVVCAMCIAEQPRVERNLDRYHSHESGNEETAA